MKKIWLLSVVIVTYGPKNALFAQNANEDFKKLDWLEGTWTRTNAKPGRPAHEKWHKISSSEWSGLGVNMKGNDTAFVGPACFGRFTRSGG